MVVGHNIHLDGRIENNAGDAADNVTNSGGGSGGANKSGDAPWNKVQNQKGGGKGGRGR